MSTHPIPSAALNQHIAVLGKTGSGKTYAAKGLVERFIGDGRQVCVIDPTGAWWGLRLGADGKSKGYDVVLLGGQHADIPLSERSGAAVARLVTEQHASVVIDTSGLSVGEYTRWFIDFAGTLYTTIRNPLQLVIDEAHYFMPQGKAPDVDAGKMIHAGNRLMSGGRSLGIRGMLITQRPAKLHKDSLTCADSLLAMRVIAPQDRQAIKDWIDGAGDAAQGRAVLDSLAGLQKGEGWFWYPEGGFLQRMKFSPIKTYDSSATPVHGAKAGPKVGEINLDDVKAAMAEAVREAEANDPKKLRARIAELEREAAKKQAPVVMTPTIDLDGVRRVAKTEAIAGVARLVRGILAAANGVAHDAEAVVASIRSLETLMTAAPVAHDPAALNGEARHHTTAPAGVGLSKRQQRFLDAAATLTRLDVESTRESVCAWIGVHPRGGSVGEELKALEDAGYVTLDRGAITVTEAGWAVAGTISNEEAISAAKNSLTPRQGRIFEIVSGVYPARITREQVAAQMDIHPRGGSFGEDIARLVGRGLIESARGELQARAFLFAGGGHV